MAEPNTTGGYVIFVLFGAIFSTLEQGPAMGALFGSFFFLATPSPQFSVAQKTLLLFFSLGLGYGAGVGVTAFGGWEKLSMFASTLCSALGAGGVSSWHNYQNGGPVPKWILFILDRLPFLNKRGEDNG